MKKQWVWMLVMLVVLTMFAPAAFAQEPAGASSKALSGIAVGFGMAIAAFGCGLAQGRIALSGGRELALELEKHGYGWIEAETSRQAGVVS